MESEKSRNKVKPEVVCCLKEIYVVVKRCPHCFKDYVSGDGMEDYGYIYCPHCGKKLEEEE